MSPDSAVSTPWLAALIVVGWLIVFPLFWLGITGLLSIVGGWRELATTYAADPATWQSTPAQTTTGALQRWFLPVNYSHTLRVHVRDDGFGLATVRAFRFMHPPLFIPWTAVRDCQRRSIFSWSYAKVRLHGSSVTLRIGGHPGHDISKRWRTVGATPSAAPVMAHIPRR